MNLIKLLKSGIYLGSNIKILNSSTKNFILYKINNNIFFNIKKIIISLINLKNYINYILKKNKQILFINTKNSFKEIIYKYAKSLKQPFIVNKWISGSLTNIINYKKMLNKLNFLKKQKKLLYTKKEKNIFLKKEKKIEFLFGGLKNLKKLPEVIFLTDVKKDKIIVKEAKILKIKIISLIDSNDNCNNIDYIIPCNNDSIESIKYILKIIFSEIC